MKEFTTYDCGLTKKRFGKDNDGGYVIADGLQYDCFLSCGIGNDLSFETDFLHGHNVPVAHIFDNTAFFMEAEIGAEFHRLNIAAVNCQGYTNLQNYLEKYANVFIKMDIEGHEFEWLKTLQVKHLLSIRQIVIELHEFEKAVECVKILNQTHALIHIHGNNYGGVTEFEDGIVFPNVVECTFVRGADFRELSLNKSPMPSEIDLPNNPNKHDYNLNFPPIVNP